MAHQLSRENRSGPRAWRLDSDVVVAFLLARVSLGSGQSRSLPKMLVRRRGYRAQCPQDQEPGSAYGFVEVLGGLPWCWARDDQKASERAGAFGSHLAWPTSNM